MLRNRWAVLAVVAAVTVTGAASLVGTGQLASAGTQTNRKAATGQAATGQAATGASGAVNTPSAVVTHHFTIAASAFAPDSLRNTASDYFNQWSPSALSNQDGSRCFDAAVDLPNGAKMSSITFFYTAGSNSLYMELNRQDLINHNAVIVATFSAPSSATPTYTSTTVPITTNQVVTTLDAYSLGVCPNGTSAFSGATIAYTG